MPDQNPSGKKHAMRPLRLVLAAAACLLQSALVHADGFHAGIDPRFIGSWKFDSYLGTVIFHTSFANGDFKRSVYDHGHLADVSKGTWSADGNIFHIVFLRRATGAHPDRFATIEQHIDQAIIEVAADSYVVHEPSARGAGLIKWVRIGGSDISQYKADERDPPAAPAPDTSPAGTQARSP
jgi:hypothetical protein